MKNEQIKNEQTAITPGIESSKSVVIIRLPQCPDEMNCRAVRVDVGPDKAICVGTLIRPHGEHKYSMCIFYGNSVTRLLLKDVNIRQLKLMINALEEVAAKNAQSQK